MLKILLSFCHRLFAACEAFWKYEPSERLPDIYEPQSFGLQAFRAQLGDNDVQIVRAVRSAFPGHLVVQGEDGLSAGIIGEEKVHPADREKFHAALKALPGHW